LPKLIIEFWEDFGRQP